MLSVPTDGSIVWSWPPHEGAATVLLVRAGKKPGYASFKIDAALGRFEITNLSRHQRYLSSVLHTPRAVEAWTSITPSAGSEPAVADCTLAAHLAAITQLSVMPQSQRLTVYWTLNRGFCDYLRLTLRHSGEMLAQFQVAPEARHFVIDTRRFAELRNDVRYELEVTPVFADVVGPSRTARCVLAAQGRERAANQSLQSEPLVFACLDLGDEQDPFSTFTTGPTQSIVCAHCHGRVQWDAYALRCTGCSAEFIANGQGAYLDVAKLRFGTCRCCMPKKLLIQEPGSESLSCVHSGKEYVRLSGAPDYQLLEDLPLGLCACCRPRRPLAKKGEEVRCSKSRERHTLQPGQGFVLQMSAPVFDARAIDDLLDAGLAELSSTHVSRGR